MRKSRPLNAPPRFVRGQMGKRSPSEDSDGSRERRRRKQKRAKAKEQDDSDGEGRRKRKKEKETWQVQAVTLHGCFIPAPLRAASRAALIVIFLFEPSPSFRASNHDMKTAASCAAPCFKYATHCACKGCSMPWWRAKNETW